MRPEARLDGLKSIVRALPGFPQTKAKLSLSADTSHLNKYAGDARLSRTQPDGATARHQGLGEEQVQGQGAAAQGALKPLADG